MLKRIFPELRENAWLPGNKDIVINGSNLFLCRGCKIRYLTVKTRLMRGFSVCVGYFILRFCFVCLSFFFKNASKLHALHEALSRTDTGRLTPLLARVGKLN